MDAASTAEPPRCRCGHDRDHAMVSPEADRGFLGWVSVLVGISAVPTRIRFRCRKCDQVLEETTDPAILKKHAG